MAETTVLEYKCPTCDAGLVFGSEAQRLTCEYCGNTFALEEVRAFHEGTVQTEDRENPEHWAAEEQEHLNAFQCPTCAGQILTDDTTAATFCPYCGNPSVLPTRLSGELRPDGVIPFQRSREEAALAFRRLCKRKPLLPKAFEKQQLEKLTGVYVPFWLFDCKAEFEGRYKSTTIRRWSDSRYHYTRTSHYHVERDAVGEFRGIPVDASSKMADTMMEAIEPYDYAQLTDFDMGYLSGYLADQYDVRAESCTDRIRDRVQNTMQSQAEQTVLGYHTTVPTMRKTELTRRRTRYVLLPVWMCSTKFRGKIYTFAMNGQTGKMIGNLPVSFGRAAAWFAGIFTGVSALAYAILWHL